eukprot:TRINITY_DN48922_c0_g1_i1.p1 TRINITY_DN48922_c0_g1~~TRINITY_DN48922_c0_g1_i1.p1  ORF type:complete len:253 (+),score=43.96 TRINITY_DN48922_c0_g1_i1:75-833(+)
MQGSPADARTIWMGLRFSTEADRSAVSKVLLAASLMAIMQLLIFLVKMVSAHSFRVMESSFVNLVIGLLLPTCGYFGAKHSNRWLMGLFCGCSWCSVCGLLLVMLLLANAWVSVTTTDKDAACRPEACVVSEVPVTVPAGGSGAAAHSYTLEELSMNCTALRRSAWKAHHGTAEELREACLEELDEAEHVLTWSFMVITCLVVPNCMLASYAGWHGSELCKRLEQGETFVMQPSMDPMELSTEPLHAQPAIE